MKRLIVYTLVLSASAFRLSAADVKPAIAPDAQLEARIEKQLSGMSLDDKVGQMVQLTFDAFKYTRRADGKGAEINKAFMDSVFRNYKIGSVLNKPFDLASTKEEYQEYIRLIQKLSLKYSGIPCVYGLDQNHGPSYIQGGTMFPQNINVAASFNPEIARRAAEITAYETRAGSVAWTFSPTLDLSRDPRWPRQWEDYGEDAYLSSVMAAAAVRGFQGDDPNHIDNYHIASTPKHYMGYGVPVSGKDRTPAVISPEDLREKHFAPFRSAIEAGALTVMVNSGSINGVPVHASRELLTGWLKEGLNWDGMIVTDWADINNLYTREKVAKDKKDALCVGINAGIDMIMEPYQCDVEKLIKELVSEGKIPQSRIDDAVRRVLRLKFRLGLFDSPLTKPKDYPAFGSSAHAEVALRAAEESMVLLKNNKVGDRPLLPLPKGTKILLTGPNANRMRCLNGGWTYSWQGKGADELAGSYNTVYEALCNKFGKENVTLEQGVSYDENGSYDAELQPEIHKVVEAAAGADVIIACIGENSYCETPGNLSDLNLSENQRNLVKALKGSGKPVVLLLNEGRPRIVRDIEPGASAIVDMMLPGNYGGDAIANLLAGDANFSGRLPMTYPKEQQSLINYDYKPSQEVDKMQGAYDYTAVVSVQWAFGYGLSYTDFAYSNFHVNKSHFKDGDVLEFKVDVKNTGARAGKESVLLFSSDLVASVTPDVRRLRAFEKIFLEPGETKTVVLRLPARSLAFVGADGKWRLEEGDFRLQAGNQVLTVTCDETKVWDEPNI